MFNDCKEYNINKTEENMKLNDEINNQRLARVREIGGFNVIINIVKNEEGMLTIEGNNVTSNEVFDLFEVIDKLQKQLKEKHEDIYKLYKLFSTLEDEVE